MENWKRREKTLTAIPFCRYWRATLIKRGGGPGSTGQAYIKTMAKGPGESVNYKPFIITNPSQSPPSLFPPRHLNSVDRAEGF